MVKIISNKAFSEQLSWINEYEQYSIFDTHLSFLKKRMLTLAPKLSDRKIWMINSTSEGGGVAEMLPSLIGFLRKLGLTVDWAIIESNEQSFFDFTKRIHNLVHGVQQDPKNKIFSDLELYEQVNKSNAASLKSHLKNGDILLLHDPQPLPLGYFLSQEMDLIFLWRCHIGVPYTNEQSSFIWKHLKKYLDSTTSCAFTSPEYIPKYLKHKSTIIQPAINPLSHKNQELSFYEVTSILSYSGICKSPSEAPTPLAFGKQVLRLLPNGEMSIPEDNSLLFKPIILQISRWDKLKGWKHLINGFAHFKESLKKERDLPEDDLLRLRSTCLVMAAPDPLSIPDDLEAIDFFEEIKEIYFNLAWSIQRDCYVFLLPMESRKENALIVNALQRLSSVIVQASREECFGLTVTEAMWKRRPVIGSNAFGIKLQVKDHHNGRIVEDISNPQELSDLIIELLINKKLANSLSQNSRWSVVKQNLLFTQVSQYLDFIEAAIT